MSTVKLHNSAERITPDFMNPANFFADFRPERSIGEPPGGTTRPARQAGADTIRP